MDRQTFTYWDSDDFDPIAGHLDQWRSRFPLHAVLTRSEARLLLLDRSPRYLEVFDRIAMISFSLHPLTDRWGAPAILRPCAE